jgi:hypothetical protein
LRWSCPSFLIQVVPTQSALYIDLAILILTYMMLGWGLNIVVGLAGLLDLGYVAFYAVGAYSFALLAQNLASVLDLPASSRHPCRPLGMMLGFPVLRLRGDYLAHRNARLRRDHPGRDPELVRFHQRPERYLGHRSRPSSAWSSAAGRWRGGLLGLDTARCIASCGFTTSFWAWRC